MLKNEFNIGSNVPNLSQDTDVLNIHCNLINESLVESLVDGQETSFIPFQPVCVALVTHSPSNQDVQEE